MLQACSVLSHKAAAKLTLIICFCLQGFALGTMVKVGPDYTEVEAGQELGTTGVHVLLLMLLKHHAYYYSHCS